MRDILDGIKQTYDMISVASMAGIRLRRSGPSYLVACCPFHRESTPSFKVRSKDPHRFRCYGCDRSGDIFTFVGILYGLPKLNEQVQFITGLTLREHAAGLTTAEAADRFAALKEKRAAEIKQRQDEIALYQPAPDDKVIPTFEALLDMLDLSGTDCDRMKERGLDPAQCYAWGYRTLPVPRSERIRICEAMIADGHTLTRVPGFFRLPAGIKGVGGRWCVAGSSLGWREVRDRKTNITLAVEGMIVPTCNADGRVVRLKLRNASAPENLPEYLQKSWPQKYIILSSDQLDGGANAGVRLHYSGPRDGGRWPRVLWTTEGEIKSDVSALLLDARFTGLPGVTQSPELVIQAALDGGYTTLNIAMDQESKPDKRATVAYANERLARMAFEAGLTTNVVVWNSGQAKGFDDLLVKRGQWAILRHDDWWASLSPPEREYAEARLDEEFGARTATII
ncbi:MAG TPA: CHC2 zinc finger domain-containing protein [Blastocatellia bacterium]|nr:CHC2 zinc finger domain-containing protein [Blastocatellia bacterium]